VATDVKTKSGLEVQDVLAEVGSSYIEKYEKLLNESETSYLVLQPSLSQK